MRTIVYILSIIGVIFLTPSISYACSMGSHNNSPQEEMAVESSDTNIHSCCTNEDGSRPSPSNGGCCPQGACNCFCCSSSTCMYVIFAIIIYSTRSTHQAFYNQQYYFLPTFAIWQPPQFNA